MTPAKKKRGRGAKKPSAPQRTQKEIRAAAKRAQAKADAAFLKRARKLARETGKSLTNAKRSLRTREAWRQAREYAKRNNTTPTLAKRATRMQLTNRDIVRAFDELARRKTRKPGGKRGSTRRRDTELRVVVRRKDGKALTGKNGLPVQEIRSDDLRIPGTASAEQIRKALRNATFAVIGADLEYDAGLGELHVGDDGEMDIAGDELEILLENVDEHDAPFDLFSPDEDDDD